jgi:hypothetical protein
MSESGPYFVIPAHRLRDAGATIHVYDEHFWRSGHSLQMIVFGLGAKPRQRQVRTNEAYEQYPR